MQQLSLRQAAQEVGTSKSTILRAVKAGRLSAMRDDDGGYQIDPAELHRVYPPDRLVPRNTTQRTTGGPEVEILVRNAALEAENKALRNHLEAEKRRADEIREERDIWRGQFERLQLVAPIVTPAPAPTNQMPIVSEPKRSAPASRGRALWRWLRAS